MSGSCTDLSLGRRTFDGGRQVGGRLLLSWLLSLVVGGKLISVGSTDGLVN